MFCKERLILKPCQNKKGQHLFQLHRFLRILFTAGTEKKYSKNGAARIFFGPSYSVTALVSMKKGWNTFIPHYLSSLCTLERRDPLQAERRCRPYWLALWEARPPGRSLGRAMSCLQRTVPPTRPPAPYPRPTATSTSRSSSGAPSRVGRLCCSAS